MEENKRGKTGLKILVIILFITILGLLGFGYYKYNDFNTKYDNLKQELEELKKEKTSNENTNNKTENTTSDSNTFKLDSSDHNGGYGTVIVTGYSKIDHKDENNMFNKAYDYLYFHILDSKNSDFLKFIDSHAGNDFVDEKAIGLGCVENNVIKRINTSDELGEQDFKSTTEQKDKIINSTKENPIKLKLTRLTTTQDSRTAGYMCESFITYVDIIE